MKGMSIKLTVIKSSASLKELLITVFVVTQQRSRSSVYCNTYRRYLRDTVRFSLFAPRMN